MPSQNQQGSHACLFRKGCSFMFPYGLRPKQLQDKYTNVFQIKKPLYSKGFNFLNWQISSYA